MSETIDEIIVFSITLKATKQEGENNNNNSNKNNKEEKHCYRVRRTKKSKITGEPKTRPRPCIRTWRGYERVWRRISGLLFLWVFDLLID